jgi:threonine/homoserine/homoserine lactone efflux protein
MIPIEVLGTLFAASVVLALAPGPDNIFVLTQSALHGRSASLLVTMGLCTGLLVHTAAVSFGVAALIQTSQYAFTILKFAGAAYLLYLAWQAIRAARSKIPVDANSQLTAGQLYRRGIIMNVTNPKVSILFSGVSSPIRRSRARFSGASASCVRWRIHAGDNPRVWIGCVVCGLHW